MRILETKGVLSLTIGSFLFMGCASLPAGFSSDRAAGRGLPAAYGSPNAPRVELVNSLSKLFHHAPLNRTVKLALTNNPDIQNSYAVLKEAGFSLTQAKAPLLPSLSHDLNAGRLRTNSAGTYSTFSQSLDASWEVDLWGRLRANRGAAQSSLQAAAYDYEAARQSIAGQVMQAWFNLAESEELLSISEARQQSFQKTYDTIQRKFEYGTADLASIDLARIDVETSKSLLTASLNNRDSAARALELLTGSYPTATTTAGAFPTLNHSVKAGEPSTLLLKRPDLQAAFARIQAADQRTKIAHADQFPKFSLTASLGISSTKLKRLVDPSYNIFSALGNLSTPLIDHDLRKAELGAASARAEQAYFAYQKTLLNAFSEVETALANEAALRSRQAMLQQALTSAQSAEARLQRQYETGSVELNTYLETQRRKFTIQEQLTTIKGARYRNRVALAIAVGTGI